MTLYFILGATFGLAAAAMPGPLAAFLISHSLSHGWRRTAPAAFSPLLTDGPIAALVLLLLAGVPSGMVQALRLVGGVFLLYLAVESFRSYRSFDPKSLTQSPSSGNSLAKAATVNLISPGPYLGWSVVLGPLFLQAWDQSPSSGFAVLIGFYSTMVVTMLALIAVFSAAGNLGPKVNRNLLGLSSVGLAGFAIYQFWLCAESASLFAA